jgi:hypothetical protein
MDKHKYLKFPLWLLQRPLNDHVGLLDAAMAYSVYKIVIDSGSEDVECFISFASSCFGVKYNYSANADFKLGKALYYDERNQDPKQVWAQLSLTMWWMQHKQLGTSKELDWACLRCYIALKSIQGTKPYAKTTMDYLVARMAGYASSKVQPTLDYYFTKYLVQHHRRKLLDTLELNKSWNFKKSRTKARGIYFTLSSSMTYKDLEVHIQHNRAKVKIAQLKTAKAQAYDLAKNEVAELIKSGTADQLIDRVNALKKNSQTSTDIPF